MSLAHIETTAVEAQPVAVATTGYSFSDLMTVADRIAWTAVVPSNLRGKPDEVLAVLLYGTEVGLPPMQSLQLVDNIEGRTALNAQGQRALILSKGHDFWVVDAECTNERGVVHARRKGSDVEREATFTMEDARIAGLAEKKNWKKNPRAMLIARATSMMSRLAFADVVMGLGYDPEELEDIPPRPYDIDVELARPQQPDAPLKMNPESVAAFEATCRDAGVEPADVVARAGAAVVTPTGELLAGTAPALRQAREAILAERVGAPVVEDVATTLPTGAVDVPNAPLSNVDIARLAQVAFEPWAMRDGAPAKTKVETIRRLRHALSWWVTGRERFHMDELTDLDRLYLGDRLAEVINGAMTFTVDEDSVTWEPSDLEPHARVAFAEFETEGPG